MDLALYRRFFAEEVQTAAGLSSEALVEALATVPRERFLPAGPWTIRGEADPAAPMRQTRDADPRHVCHNVAVAIDDSRMLFNGVPSLLAGLIDRLGVSAGARVLHVGTGTGYYTAVIAHVVGPTGRVLGIEIDAPLAARARANLAACPQVEIRNGDASGPLGEPFDAILVNAGVTHPLAGWLDGLAIGGRLMLPITATMPAMGPIGKGLFVLIVRDGRNDFSARPVTFVAIYSALGLRDDALNAAIGQALARSPFPRLRHLRRDAHEAGLSCWLHGPGWCLSLDDAAA